MMLQNLHQIVSHLNAMYATGSTMPNIQSFTALPKNRFSSIEQRDEVKDNDQHKRPWYAHTLHY